MGPTASLHTLPLPEHKPLLGDYPACINHYTNCYVAILYSSGRHAETAVQFPPVQKEILGII
jgi:hypothetical protein